MDVARSAPFVEKLVADGYEVLYLTEAVDEAMVGALAKYGDHDLVDVTKEGLDTGSGDDSKKVRKGRGRCRGCVTDDAAPAAAVEGCSVMVWAGRE
jgi:HSP90 family molecular chaperone